MPDTQPTSDVLCRPSGTSSPAPTGRSWLAARFVAESSHRAFTLGTRTAGPVSGKGHDPERPRTPSSCRESAHFERARSSSRHRVGTAREPPAHLFASSSTAAASASEPVPKTLESRQFQPRSGCVRPTSATLFISPSFLHPRFCVPAMSLRRMAPTCACGDRAVHAADTWPTFDDHALRSASARSCGVDGGLFTRAARSPESERTSDTPVARASA